MTTLAVDITPAQDILAAMNDRLIQSPTLMARAFRRTMLPIGRRAVASLSTEPGKPVYPLRWKSARQRRYVMAKLREEGNLPYQRTHALAKGWRYTVEPLADGGTFSVSNPSDAAPFVQGDWTQPFHLDTGWPQAAPVLSAAQEEAGEAAIQIWYTVSDPFAGVPV